MVNLVRFLGGGGVHTADHTGTITLLDNNAGIWEKMTTTGSNPPRLSGHTLIKIDASRAMLFGGQKEDGSCVNDVFILSVHSWVSLCSYGYTNACEPT